MSAPPQPTGPGAMWGPPPPPRPEPDSRPLHHRKRVWLGGVALFLCGAAITGMGTQGQADQANAAARAQPAAMATATTTTTATVTASPSAAPTPTITVTAASTVTVTATATITADSATQPPDGSSWGGSAGGYTTDPGYGPTALCNDGTYSYSAHHRGTCSHHGGVAVWYR